MTGLLSDQGMINFVDMVTTQLMRGDLSTINSIDGRIAISNIAVYLLDLDKSGIILNDNQLYTLKQILNISNILYNNTTMSDLPLEDGVYDMLMVLVQRYDPNNYPVGAPITPINVSFDDALFDDDIEEMTNVFKYLPTGYLDYQLFKNELCKYPPLTKNDLVEYEDRDADLYIGKRIKDTNHKYPKLVGTLDKCKFVLNDEAKHAGVFGNPNVLIFENDFLGYHFNSGLFNPNYTIRMDAELKYDGVSIEAEILGDTIISALSRGDTNNDVASDYTPIFGGYKFKHAKDVPVDTPFGMKFEAVISYDNLSRLNQIRNREYKNARNAIIGILGASDARKYRDYITLVPLETSLDIDRVTEIEFMNRYYHSGEYLRHCIIEGDYYSVLFQIKRFADEAECLRGFLPIMYDGIVVSYLDENIRNILGRKNFVNKYSIAIKFNAMTKQTIFTRYTFTVGKDGIITPIIHYKPIEFLGGIHTKSSGHSYKRFKELSLKVGDIVDVEYTNDVMPYCTKSTTARENLNNPNPIYPFPTHCPECGLELVYANTGNSVLCINLECPGRKLSRMVDMLKKMGFKDFSEKSLRLLGIQSLVQLYGTKLEDVQFLGPGKSEKFIERLKQVLIYTEWPDYKIIGALGFTGLAEAKWKLILSNIRLEDVMSSSDNMIYDSIKSIKGLGDAAAEVVCRERGYFINDLALIASLPNVTRSYGIAQAGKISIRFSGFRDEALAEKLKNMGFDVDLDAGVTKSTDILLVPDMAYSSTKVRKAIANGTTMVIPGREIMDYIASGRIIV